MDMPTLVWDKFIRVFHWSLIVLFCVSYFTGGDGSWLHIYAGYGVFLLVIARIVWGLIGSKHARFKNFIHSKKEVFDYGKSMLSAKPKHHLGHNPLGGLMVVAMLVMLLVTTVSGMKLYQVETGKGPFAQLSNVSVFHKNLSNEQHVKIKGDKAKNNYEFWEELHEISANIMLILIFIHIAGVLVSSKLQGRSLTKSIITGYKDNKPE